MERLSETSAAPLLPTPGTPSTSGETLRRAASERPSFDPIKPSATFDSAALGRVDPESLAAHTEALRSFAEVLRERLRERPERFTAPYQFRNTVAYWIAVCFIEGALLFTVGAAASLFHLEGWQEKALVTATYFSGGIMFTTGAYLGWFLVINVGRQRVRLVSAPPSHLDAGYWGSLSYFVGAVCFNVNTTAFLFFPDGTSAYRWGVEWVSAFFGSVLFTLAATIEFVQNKQARPHQSIFWLCFFYLAGRQRVQCPPLPTHAAPHPDPIRLDDTCIPPRKGGIPPPRRIPPCSVPPAHCTALSYGFTSRGPPYRTPCRSLFFLFAAACSFPSHFSEEQQKRWDDWLVNVPYLAGSFSFFVGAWVAMYMWKAEQFGLGFIPEINDELDSRATGETGEGARLAACPPSGSAQAGSAHAGSAHAGSGLAGSRRESSVSEMRRVRLVDPKQQVFMLVYVILGATSLIDICHSVSFPSKKAQAPAPAQPDRLPHCWTRLLLALRASVVGAANAQPRCLTHPTCLLSRAFRLPAPLAWPPCHRIRPPAFHPPWRIPHPYPMPSPIVHSHPPWRIPHPYPMPMSPIVHPPPPCRTSRSTGSPILARPSAISSQHTRSSGLPRLYIARPRLRPMATCFGSCGSWPHFLCSYRCSASPLSTPLGWS